MSVKDCDSGDEGLPQSYSYDGDLADEGSVCSEDSGICMSHELGPNAKPELNYSYGPTWNQGHPSNMHGPPGAVPYSHPVNTQWFPQPAPIVCLPPTYDQMRPSQLVPESDESENELDQSPNDDPQVKAEDQNYINPIDTILKENQELRMADVQLQSEIRTGLNSQLAMLSQSSNAVKMQLRQAQKHCEAIEKELKIVERRYRDRQISAQGGIKELRSLLMTVIEEQTMLRRYLKRKGSVQIT
ncbi:hypothetical protein FMUND_13730 [Fusarium mundagurra]|uniref:Uncharacterized protein n=1 Tax=Fusarium mundagurra TaxID=1567541 RepID=A0A8H5XYZ2_9HYPO|nr:hypothetical protein FMUND_13730 [Fusarium mundagurra]